MLLKGRTAAEPARATVVSEWAGVAATGVGAAGVLLMGQRKRKGKTCKRTG